MRMAERGVVEVKVRRERRERERRREGEKWEIPIRTPRTCEIRRSTIERLYYFTELTGSLNVRSIAQRSRTRRETCESRSSFAHTPLPAASLFLDFVLSQLSGQVQVGMNTHVRKSPARSNWTILQGFLPPLAIDSKSHLLLICLSPPHYALYRHTR